MVFPCGDAQGIFSFKCNLFSQCSYNNVQTKTHIMKSIIVKNITIQFDSFDEGADKHTALNTLENINEVLQQKFSDICPQIFVNAIDDDDIEIADENPDNE